MAQVVPFMFNDVGIVGVMVHEVGVPPEMVGVRVVIGELKTKEREVDA